MVAHPRPASANAEPGLYNLRDSSSGEAENHHDFTRAAAIMAALGAASRARPESLKASTHHNDRYAFGLLLKPLYQLSRPGLRLEGACPRCAAGRAGRMRGDNQALQNSAHASVFAAANSDEPVILRHSGSGSDVGV